MKPPFAYFGGKQGMAADIVALMPEHRVYMEPFFGSGAVLMAKPPSRFEIVNDLDRALVTFWRVLRDRPEDLEAACALTPYSRIEYELADLEEPGLDDLELARRWWVRVNQSFACTANSHTGWSVTVATGNSKPAQVLTRLGRFAAIAERIQGLSIECCDAATLITRLANERTLIYADPPYLSATRVSRFGNGGDYRFDMGTIEAHERLAEVLHVTEAKVIVSGYPSDTYTSLFADWHRIDRVVTARSSNMSRGPRGTNDRVECLWLNYEPQTAQAQFDFEVADNGQHRDVG